MSELRCWGSWGSACSHGKSCVSRTLCPGKALQGWLRSGTGEERALLGHVTFHITQTGWGRGGMGMGMGRVGCSSGHNYIIPLLPERICENSGGPAQHSASPCTPGVFSCSWAPTCSSLPAHREARSRRRASSCSLKVIWQLQGELGLSLSAECEGAALEGRAGPREGGRVAGGQDSHGNYCSSSRLKNRALLRLGFFLSL